MARVWGKRTNAASAARAVMAGRVFMEFIGCDLKTLLVSESYKKRRPGRGGVARDRRYRLIKSLGTAAGRRRDGLEGRAHAGLQVIAVHADRKSTRLNSSHAN